MIVEYFHCFYFNVAPMELSFGIFVFFLLWYRSYGANCLAFCSYLL